MTFEEVKRRIANDHRHPDWDNLISSHPDLIDRYYEEVADLIAKSLANEKMKEDRAFWVQNDIAGSLCGRSDSELTQDRWKQIHTVPLPYPEIEL